MSRCSLLFLVLFALPARSQPPAPRPPIDFPPDAVPFVPAPLPNAATPIAADELYVVQSDADMLAWTLPNGLLTITKESGPVKLRGKFVGGAGKVETKTFAKKHVLIVEAAGTGQATLLVVPVGALKETDGVIKLLDVTVAPRPPPIPPTPIPTDPFAAALQAAFDKETPADKAKRGDLAALYSEAAKPSGMVYNPANTTAGGLHVAFKAARVALVGEALPAVRKIIQNELDATLPTLTAAPLDATTRDKIAAKFNQVSQFVWGLK